jgi:hypothetical protein
MLCVVLTFFLQERARVLFCGYFFSQKEKEAEARLITWWRQDFVVVFCPHKIIIQILTQ